MTKEEIIRNLKYTMEKHKNDTVNTFDTNISVMCKDILDYFEEQEPCDDAISRKAVLDIFGYVMDYWKEHAIDVEPHEIKDALIEQYEFTAKQLNELPSVTQKPIEYDDAISRDDVEECKELMTDINGDTVYAVRMSDIRQLPPVTQKSGKWIPVSEPPKELGTYLIQTDDEPYMCQCRWTDVNPFWTDLKTKPHWNIFDLPQYSEVVAWMPLPKPYEPQESEE